MLTLCYRVTSEYTIDSNQLIDVNLDFPKGKCLSLIKQHYNKLSINIPCDAKTNHLHKTDG